MDLNNVTIVNNTADADRDGVGDGGGILNSGGTITMRNTIVAGNVDRSGEAPDCVGGVTSEGYNILATPHGCGFVPAVGDHLGVDPRLKPLADNGGWGMTHAFRKRSPAIDAGNPATPGSGGMACELTDQRGIPRNCDIGSYEQVFCGPTVVNRVGTEGKDRLKGTKKRDGFLGFGGRDRMQGKKGKDSLCGGPGNDKLKGGPGKDLLIGGPGNKDLCNGGGGQDRSRGCERTRNIP